MMLRSFECSVAEKDFSVLTFSSVLEWLLILLVVCWSMTEIKQNEI